LKKKRKKRERGGRATSKAVGVVLATPILLFGGGQTTPKALEDGSITPDELIELITPFLFVFCFFTKIIYLFM
jgi:hypothetical protein